MKIEDYVGNVTITVEATKNGTPVVFFNATANSSFRDAEIVNPCFTTSQWEEVKIMVDKMIKMISM